MHFEEGDIAGDQATAPFPERWYRIILKGFPCPWFQNGIRVDFLGWHQQINNECKSIPWRCHESILMLRESWTSTGRFDRRLKTRSKQKHWGDGNMMQ